MRVLPEFDAPAHVGNGWQFGEAEGKGKLAVCVNQEPWQVDNILSIGKNVTQKFLCRIIVWSHLAVSSTLMLTRHERRQAQCLFSTCNYPIFQQIYEILEKIYQELYNTFQFKEFHMGADEVKRKQCNGKHILSS